MSTSQPDASRPSEARAGDDRATPDDLLHTRTGTDVSPEDLVLAAGRDVTPAEPGVGQAQAGRRGPRGPRQTAAVTARSPRPDGESSGRGLPLASRPFCPGLS